MVFDEADTLCDTWPDLDDNIVCHASGKMNTAVQSGAACVPCEGLFLKGFLNLPSRERIHIPPLESRKIIDSMLPFLIFEWMVLEMHLPVL